MGQVRLAAAQMGPASEYKPDNVSRIEALLQEAGRLKADLVVLPELALSPYFPKTADENVERWADDTSTSPDVGRVVAAAAKSGVVCVLPLAERSDHGKFNSAVVIDRDGSVRGTYRKAHIPGDRSVTGAPLSGEVLHFSAGESGFQVFDTAVGRIGVIICADRAYPEAWRVLALRGAEIVAAPYNTSVHGPRPSDHSSEAGSLAEIRRIQHLRMAASALMNGYYVVAAGKGGIERGVQYLADSQIIDPWGRVVGRATTDRDELIVAHVDIERGRRDRDIDLHLARRRPKLYALLSSESATADPRSDG